MTQEEKQLLLTDICTRLPYHNLRVQYDNKDWLAMGYGHGRIELLPNPFSSIAGPCPMVEDIKPYLRPISSMTEEEEKEINEFLGYRKEINGFGDIRCAGWNGDVFVNIDKIYGYLNWLNSHHFDYRDLIEKGLALEAPEGMYKTE